MNPPPDGDETPGGLTGGVTRLPLDGSPEGAAAIESLEDSIERLRGRKDEPSPAPEPKAPPARLPRQPLWVVMAVGVVLLGAWGANDVAKRANQANRASVRYDAVVLEGEAAPAAPADVTGPSVPSTATTVITTPVAPPAAVPVEVNTTTATTATSSTTTTTRLPTTTTTAPPAPPRPVPASSSTAVFPGVRLTLSASPPASGEPRTAGFRLESEFGDVRVLRSLRIAFGDGTTLDASVVQWSCLDPAAPNPYVFVSPAHVYSAPGTHTVTATVRTAPCSLPDGSELAEETAQVQLSLPVP